MQGAISALAPLAIVALLAVPARADDVAVARQHFTQGSKAFDLGLYDQAIKEYMAAYDAKPDPALLYNIAQAHKLAGHPAEAIRFYRTYLSRVPDAPNADEVRAKIAELQKAVEQQQKAQAMPPDQVKPLGSVPPSTGTASPAAIEAPAPTVTEAPPVNAHRGRSLKIAGIAVAAVGVAALGAGIGLSVVAKQDADQLSSADQTHAVYDPGKDSTGRTFGTVGPVLIGIGAAAVVAGGVVFVLGHRAEKTPTVAAR